MHQQNPHLELKASAIAGTGCYAKEDIPKDELIGEYTGAIITDEQASELYGDDPHTYLFSIDGGKCIDATPEKHFVKYINHSCEPNCEALEEDGKIFYYALRDIHKGEELTIDYQLTAEDDDAQLCSCGAARCRGTMKPAKSKDAAQ